MNRSRMIIPCLMVAGSILCFLPLVMAQQPKSEPKSDKQAEPKLEELYEKALKNSPDIQLAKSKIKAAEAKLSEANAELKKAQQMVLARVQQIQSEIEQLQGKTRFLKQDQNIAKLGQARQFEELGLEIKSFEAKISALKLELQSIIDTPSPKTGTITFLDALSRNPKINPNEFPALRNWLQSLDHPPNCPANWSRVSCSDCHTISAPKSNQWIEKVTPQLPNAFESEQMQIFKALKGKVKLPATKEPIRLPNLFENLEKLSPTPIRFRLINHPDLNEVMEFLIPVEETKSLATWLQEIGDLLPYVRFVVRDYGILVTVSDRLPEEGINVREFIRQMERQRDRIEAKPKSEPSNPPTSEPKK